MKHFYHLFHIGSIICLFVGALSAGQKPHRRCIGEFFKDKSKNTTDRRNLLSSLHQETVCESYWQGNACQRGKVGQKERYHVMILLSEIHQEFLAIAAGLLTDPQFQVTTQYFVSESSNKSNASVRDDILSRHPCKPDSKIRDSLSVIKIGIDFDESTCTPTTASEPFDLCSIRQAPQMIAVLQSTMQSPAFSASTLRMPDVMVMDTSNVAGLLLAETLEIPAVILGTHKSMDLAIEHDPEWTPNPDWHFFYRLYRVLCQRVYSLSLTTAFLELNKNRRQMGLVPLSRPTDYFLPVVAILVEYLPQDIVPDISQNYWNIVHITGAMQPPCTPCISVPKQTSSRKRKSAEVLVALPYNSSAEDVRSLLKGLFMARSSLETYDDCEWDPLSCRNDAANFTVTWLDFGKNMDFFPEVVPSFVTREPSLGLLDSLSRHPNTVTVLAHCDSNFPIVSELGVSILCVWQSERLPEVTSVLLNRTGRLEHREIARHLISSLRSRTLEYESSIRKDDVHLDGLSKAVSLLRVVAATQREHAPWRSTPLMQQVISRTLVDSLQPVHSEQGETGVFEEELPYDAFTVLIALIVVLSTGIYILLRDSFPSLRRSQRSHYRTGDFSGGIMTRLPDLDDAVMMLADWYKEQPPLILSVDDSIEQTHSTKMSKKALESSRNHHHHPASSTRRKKRK
jgi:hypothetical protein